MLRNSTISPHTRWVAGKSHSHVVYKHSTSQHANKHASIPLPHTHNYVYKHCLTCNCPTAHMATSHRVKTVSLFWSEYEVCLRTNTASGAVAAVLRPAGDPTLFVCPQHMYVCVCLCDNSPCSVLPRLLTGDDDMVPCPENVTAALIGSVCPL